jgi:drug/metabolite transporter (DMT)-like permease
VRRALAPRLLVDLLKRPSFLLALAINAAGSVLQVLALHFGSLAVVQPLVVLDLLFGVLIGAVAIRHRAPDRTMLAGAACCAAGIGGFLAAARPGGGAGIVAPGAAVPLGAGLTAALAGCLAAARWGPRGGRPLWLALACGVDFGVNAFLLKVVPVTLGLGFGEPLRQWPLYMLLVVAPAGFLLNQNAFQAGRLIAPVLSIITVADPLVSITLGHFLLHEAIAGTTPAVAGGAVALAVMAAGIVALAHRAPRLEREREGRGEAKPEREGKAAER